MNAKADDRPMLSVRFLKAVIFAIVVYILICGPKKVFAGSTAGIDDDTVITVEQAGSVATSSGDYGWDSRGAVVRYYSLRGDVNGSLGEILFRDIDGKRHNGIWSGWGNEFPDWWIRQMAERIRNATPDSRIAAVRRAFSDSITFEATWMIAIGIKSNAVGGKLYKTLRTDRTLRVAYAVDLDKENPPEMLFMGDEMATSLRRILPGEDWGNSSQATFKERNPYIFSVRINSYDIDLRATNCTECASKGLPSGSTKCTHTESGKYFNIKLPIEYNGKTYGNDKSFAWEGQTVTFTEPQFVGFIRAPYGDDLSGLIGTMEGNRIIPTGDCTVFLYYEADPSGTEEDPEEYPEDPEEDPENPEDNPEEDVNIEASYNGSVLNPEASVRIYSDVFDASTAIPSSESVKISASAKDCLFTLDASVISGTMPVRVNVTVPYRLVWTEDGKEKSEDGSIDVAVNVYREYAYNHLNAFAYSVLESVTVGNPALSPSQVKLTAAQAGIKQSVCANPVIYGGSTPVLGGNVALPDGFTGNVTASTVVITGENERPEPPKPDSTELRAVAEAATGKLKCRNDEVIVNGTNILGSIGWHDYYGTETMNTSVLKPVQVKIDSGSILGTDGIFVSPEKRNGTYFTNVALVSYTPVIRYGGATVSYNPRLEANPVRVHTPVLCTLKIGECDILNPNSAYNQETCGVENGVFQLIIGGSDSYGIEEHEYENCDFMLGVGNSGSHSVYSGRIGTYFDYSRNVSGRNGGTYVKTNEVRFPFDVYIDIGNDGNVENDIRISAGTWYSVGTRTYRFYVPHDVTEGDYVIEARTTAINSYSINDFSIRNYKNGKAYAPENTFATDYVAADNVKVHISGKLYGLKIYDISSKAEWTSVFRDSEANKYIVMRDNPGVVPAAVSGERNYLDGTLKNVLNKGNVNSDRLKEFAFYYTVGTRNELGIQTGRHERFIFPLLNGSMPDAARQNTGMLKSGYVWKFELCTTGTQMKENGSSITITPKFIWISADGTERLPAEVYNKGNDISKDKRFSEITVTEHTDSNDEKQTWRFEYFLPSELAVGIGGMERNEGYLVISFEITASDAAGKPRYSYSGPGACNMWEVEGQQLKRTDYYGNEFIFDYGDVVILDISKTGRGDYRSDRKY